MATIYLCDQCGSEVPEDVIKRQTKSFSIQFGTKQLHFCTEECVVKFIMANIVKEGGA